MLDLLTSGLARVNLYHVDDIVHGPGHYDKTMGRLKSAYYGEYQLGLEIHEKVLGSEHPETLDIRVASILRAQGDYVESEALHRRVLRLRQRVFGPDSLATIDGVSMGLGQPRSDDRVRALEPTSC